MGFGHSLISIIPEHLNLKFPVYWKIPLLAHYLSNHTDRSSNDGMYILFTESHEILANSIYVFHTYERKWDRGMKSIFDASSNLRQVQQEQYRVSLFSILNFIWVSFHVQKKFRIIFLLVEYIEYDWIA